MNCTKKHCIHSSATTQLPEFICFAGTQSTNDYYPFGSQLPGRGFDVGSYKFGFNGKENDDEVYGDGNFQDYGMRYYDTRVGRFVSVDPITKEYPELTPYQFASNTPIKSIDLDGLEEFTRTNYYTVSGKLYKTEIKMVTCFWAERNVQIVHHTSVKLTQAPDGTYSFTTSYDGTTVGTTTGQNAFTAPTTASVRSDASMSDIYRMKALKVDATGRPEVTSSRRPIRIRTITYTASGTPVNGTVSATGSYLVPGTGVLLEPGYCIMAVDAHGNDLGLVSGTGPNGDSRSMTVTAPDQFFTFNSSTNPTQYSATPTDYDVSNIKNVPFYEMGRTPDLKLPDGTEVPSGTNQLK